MARPRVSKDLILTKADRRAVVEGCWFDAEAADFAVDFIEGFCSLSKGKRAGNKVRLIEWQRNLVRALFGWKRGDGTRRFRSAYVEIGKKNGKSLLMSAIAIYMAMADGEKGAEVYLAALNSKQARIVFDECMRMVAASPALKKRLRVRDTLKKIEYPANHAKIECVTADAESQDGFDAHCVIFDELHRQKNRKLWEVFEFAGSGREQPLIISITTAGSNKDSLCWLEHERARKILDGESTDTSHLAMIFAADRENDDLDDPATWRKANPSLGHTLSEEQFARDLAKVRESPSGLNNFLRLRLCVWAEAETSYIAHDVWEACGGPIDLAALKGKPCFAGMDISSKKDLTAFSMLFGDENNGFTVLPHFWIPEREAREREKENNIPYSRWAQDGFVTIIPGPAIDYDQVVADIVSLTRPYRVHSVTSDMWGSSDAVGQRLVLQGLKAASMGQGFKSMSEPTKELERQALLGKLRHGDNPVLTWMNANALVISDAAGNVKLVKPKPASPLKIDGLVATLNAMFAHLLIKRPKPNAYSKPREIFIRR